MKNRLKRLSQNILKIIAWCLGIIFIIGGLGLLADSLGAGVMTILLGLLLLSPVGALFRKSKIGLLSKYGRIILISIAFVTAVALTPAESTKSPVLDTANEARQTNASVEAVKDKKQILSKINYSHGVYKIEGSGLGNAEYVLSVPGSSDIHVTTSADGNFVQEIPDSTQVFGLMELTRDTNGAWPGGREIYDTKYFTLVSHAPVLSKDMPSIVIHGIAKNDSYNMSGYYLPGKDLVLKSASTTLAATKVDNSGRYSFADFELKENYAEVSVHEKVSTGWFKSEDKKISQSKYLDIENLEVISELPIIVKELALSEAIDFTSRNVQTSKLQKGVENVVQEGVKGEKRHVYKVTYKGNNEVARELIRTDIIKHPIEKITNVGTYVYVAPNIQKPAPVSTPRNSSNNERTGALCGDGTTSSATGRGACSHHGGVARWLY